MEEYDVEQQVRDLTSQDPEVKAAAVLRLKARHDLIVRHFLEEKAAVEDRSDYGTPLVIRRAFQEYDKRFTVSEKWKIVDGLIAALGKGVGSDFEKDLAASQKESDLKGEGRVVFVPSSPQFLGNRENYHVTRSYPTHVETWHIVETRLAKLNRVPLEVEFRDREGLVWVVWHMYHHTHEEAEAQAMRIINDCNTLAEPLMQVFL